MIDINKISKNVANNLLQIKAIKLAPTTPFTWASGIKSPIYCDNRTTLAFPKVRNFIRDSFVQVVKEKYPDVDIVAGVATGAIAHGVLVAEALNKPFIYVRPEAKKHGLGNKIEGYFEKGQSVVVIEDLLSTGGSSIKAIDALREAEINVLGLVAIFTYNFTLAEDNFKNAKCKWDTLSNYNDMITIAYDEGYINENEIETLKEWRKNPQEWR
jgi:orotate phosphoribosyltransferase